MTSRVEVPGAVGTLRRKPASVLILGSGPVVIGQAAEFDYAGTQACRALRAEGNDVRFGFVTSESTTEMREQAIEAGAEFLIGKPFTADDFADILDN